MTTGMEGITDPKKQIEFLDNKLELITQLLSFNLTNILSILETDSKILDEHKKQIIDLKKAVAVLLQTTP